MADNTEKLATLSNLSDNAEEMKRILKQVRAYIDKQDSAKVDKVSGKGLSTNDLTTELLNKLNSLENYDDTAVRNLIKGISSRIDTLVGESASEAIDNFNEILAFLNGVTDTQTLQGLLSNLKAEFDGLLANKVDKVSGKQLSTNDYTTAEKTKLSGIEEGAQKNTVTGVKGNAESSYRTGNVNLTPADIGAAAASHTHAISEIADLQATLNGKAAASHTHSASDITSGTLSIDRIADGSITKEKLAEGVLDSKILISTIYIDQTITDPATMISGDINGAAIQAIRANSHRYLGKYTAENTMTICQLLDANSKLFHDGTVADLTGAQGDVFMRLPLFYTKAKELSADFWQIQFAFGGQPDGDGWMQWGGNDLIGVYEGYVSGDRLYSRSGVTPTTNLITTHIIQYGEKRGHGFSCGKLKNRNIMSFLSFAYYGTTNIQSICGVGTDSVKVTGGTNFLGMTDTTISNGNSMSINLWGLENWYGDLSELCDNVIFSPDVVNGIFKITEDDGNIRNVQSIQQFRTSLYPTKIIIGKYLDIFTSPNNVIGTSDTGYCDNQWYDNSANMYVNFGGSSNTVSGGVVNVAATSFPSYSNTDTCGRLTFTGNVIIENDPSTFKSLTAIG